jgi:hypothetical protein
MARLSAAGRCSVFVVDGPQKSSRLLWYVPAPDEALLISGSKRHQQDTEFRIVSGHGRSFTRPSDNVEENVRWGAQDLPQ